MPTHSVRVHCAGVTAASRDKPDLVLNLHPRGSGRHSLTLTLHEVTQQMMAMVPDRQADLLDIACYVHCADRRTKRGGLDMQAHGEKWRRNLRFLIGVRDPGFWAAPDINDLLCNTLGFLSGDRFSFDFVRLELTAGRQTYLDLQGEGPHDGFVPQEIILFSGGLDSLAGAVDALLVRHLPVVLVSHQSAPFVQSIQNRLAEALRQRAGPGRLLHIGLGVSRAGEMTEPTQRTRSFLFAAIALLIARLFNRNGVSFYENGIVSTNLPIASHVLGTRATRTTLPKVLHDYSRLFSRVAAADIRVGNPFFWDTKADVIRRIANAGCGDLIAPSFSCGSTRDATLSGGLHCGTCTQCLDRRFGILAGGYGHLEPANNYAVELFRGAREPGVDAVTAESFVLAAHRYAKSSEQGFLGAHGEVFRALPYLGPSPAVAASKLHQLHMRHGQAVIEVLGQNLVSHDPIADRLSLPDQSLLAMLHGPLAHDIELRDPVEREPTAQQQVIQRSIRVVPRPIVFRVDERRRCIHFEGGITLTKQHAEIVLKLLPNFQQGQRAGTGPEGFLCVETRALAASIGKTDTSLRQFITGLRKTIKEQFETAFGAAPQMNEIIENDRWKGYRLSPHLELRTDLTEAAAAE
jgi:hypothetical protein